MKTKICAALSGLLLVGVLGASSAEAGGLQTYRDFDAKVKSSAIKDYGAVKIYRHRPYSDYIRRSNLGLKVVEFARSKLGQQIGDGQCTRLVEAALAAAGAKPGSGYVWGTNVTGQTMQPGDIIQFEGCRFENGYSWFEMPHHTAIVETASGTSVTILHQNFGSLTVIRTDLDLAWKKSGYYTVYRPTN